MKAKIKQYISHWAFITLGEFSDNDSLKALRPDFGLISKLAMLTACTYPKRISYDENEIMTLDSVDDFVEFLKNKKCNDVNNPPTGYE